MKQGQFEALYQPTCARFEQLLGELESKKSMLRDADLAEFAPLYRKLCHFHALAKERQYSSYLVDHLGDLVIRGHQQLYRRKQPLMHQFLRFVVTDFPCLVRQEQRYFWLATALLYVPGLLLFLAVSAIAAISAAEEITLEGIHFKIPDGYATTLYCAAH